MPTNYYKGKKREKENNTGEGRDGVRRVGVGIGVGEGILSSFPLENRKSKDYNLTMKGPVE
jgi:hypothetical protein